MSSVWKNFLYAAAIFFLIYTNCEIFKPEDMNSPASVYKDTFIHIEISDGNDSIPPEIKIENLSTRSLYLHYVHVNFCTFRLYRLQAIEKYDGTPLHYNDLTKTWQLARSDIYIECLEDPGVYTLRSRKENTYTEIMDPIEFSGLIYAYFLYSLQEIPENDEEYTTATVAFRYNMP